MLRENRVKRALRECRVVVGPMVSEMRSPAIGLIMAVAGFDFMSIDMEHGTHTIEIVADLTKVARLGGSCRWFGYLTPTTSFCPVPSMPELCG